MFVLTPTLNLNIGENGKRSPCCHKKNYGNDKQWASIQFDIIKINLKRNLSFFVIFRQNKLLDYFISYLNIKIWLVSFSLLRFSGLFDQFQIIDYRFLLLTFFLFRLLLFFLFFYFHYLLKLNRIIDIFIGAIDNNPSFLHYYNIVSIL